MLLFSGGKDSIVLLRLAEKAFRPARFPFPLMHLAFKAFHPAPLPFPVMHVDTTWKFREMIAFRDRRMKELGLPLTVHVNQDGLGRGIGQLRAADDQVRQPGVGAVVDQGRAVEPAGREPGGAGHGHGSR